MASSGDDMSEDGSEDEEFAAEDGAASEQDDSGPEDADMTDSDGGVATLAAGRDDHGRNPEANGIRTPAGSPRPATRPQTPKARPASSPAGGAGKSLDRDREVRVRLLGLRRIVLTSVRVPAQAAFSRFCQ